MSTWTPMFIATLLMVLWVLAVLALGFASGIQCMDGDPRIGVACGVGAVVLFSAGVALYEST